MQNCRVFSRERLLWLVTYFWKWFLEAGFPKVVGADKDQHVKNYICYILFAKKEMDFFEDFIEFMQQTFCENYCI